MTVFVRNLQRLQKVDRELLSQVTGEILRVAGAHDDTVGIILVNDRQIARFNENFHKTPGPTDILTFHYPELEGGELTISVERAVEHAKRYRTSPGRELALYIVHGILHLHGYDDRTPHQRVRMRAAERRILATLSRTFDLSRLAVRKPSSLRRHPPALSMARSGATRRGWARRR